MPNHLTDRPLDHATAGALRLEPWDTHNQALVRNVHPPDWVNPEPAGRYNLVVIGAGAAGLVTAIGAAGLGAKVAPGARGKRLTADSHGRHYDLEVDEILVGVGRRPNVEGLGLEKTGVAFDQKGVAVNDRLQTTNPRIFAAGDICPCC